eukprot:scaffold12780_cov67-Phaeocystis_antarctica.AAC.1
MGWQDQEIILGEGLGMGLSASGACTCSATARRQQFRAALCTGQPRAAPGPALTVCELTRHSLRVLALPHFTRGMGTQRIVAHMGTQRVVALTSSLRVVELTWTSWPRRP